MKDETMTLKMSFSDLHHVGLRAGKVLEERGVEAMYQILEPIVTLLGPDAGNLLALAAIGYAEKRRVRREEEAAAKAEKQARLDAERDVVQRAVEKTAAQWEARNAHRLDLEPGVAEGDDHLSAEPT